MNNDKLKSADPQYRKQKAIYNIENTTPTDLNFIYWLFDEAMAYQKKNNYIGWNSYDKKFIQLDIERKLQFKIVSENVILCIFSICYSDVLIWREREKGDAIYLHRIVVNPELLLLRHGNLFIINELQYTTHQFCH